jgi:hypothetical protein
MGKNSKRKNKKGGTPREGESTVDVATPEKVTYI